MFLLLGCRHGFSKAAPRCSHLLLAGINEGCIFLNPIPRDENKGRDPRPRGLEAVQPVQQALSVASEVVAGVGDCAIGIGHRRVDPAGDQIRKPLVGLGDEPFPDQDFATDRLSAEDCKRQTG
ncbi:MAG: hypothetical protein HY654_02465 [Acidobacteria bacterium]|nr:hypothetical protein [Acidobacteriota bacterium]